MHFYKILSVLFFSVSSLFLMAQGKTNETPTKVHHLHLNDDAHVTITLPKGFTKGKIADKNNIATFEQSATPPDVANIKSISIKATDVEPSTSASENYTDDYLEDILEGFQYTIEGEGKMQKRKGYFVRVNYSMGSNSLEGVIYFLNKKDQMLRVFFSIANGSFDEVNVQLSKIMQNIKFEVTD